MVAPVRVMAIWCPDWPVYAAELVDGVPATAPVAVIHTNRVVACSPAARREGVTVGLRRREAQGRCPELTVVAYDPGRDARAFEPVVAAVEQVATPVAVIRPGSAVVAARGPTRYFGSEERAAERIVEQIAQECEVEAQVGIADGVFAAELAARTGRIVPPGQSAGFLAPVPVAALARPELTDRLRRLGIRTLGQFAGLAAGDVLARFGFDAALAHRLAAGADDRPLAVRRPPPELTVCQEYDDPLDRIDVAAFAARSLAERLHARLGGHGLACTRLVIEAVTDHGQELRRSWRHDGVLTVAGITDRVRWQLEGWLAPPRPGGPSGPDGPAHPARPTAGIRRLRLRPDGVVSQAALQPGLWGDPGDGAGRADRAVARVQGLLGPSAVVRAVVQGGRGPADRVRLVPWGEDPGEPSDPDAPWPGRLPAPAPATVLPEPLPVAVYGADGAPVRVDARLAVSAAPARLEFTGDRAPDGTPSAGEIVGWAGPWPVDETWWAPQESHRAARFQVLLSDGRGLLLSLVAGQWRWEASYD